MATNPLLDKAFLNELAEQRERATLVKIISYNNQGIPQETLEGVAIDGSINIDGASSVRRSCSLTLIAADPDDTTGRPAPAIHDFYWSLTTQFQLFIGMENLINPDYDDVIWFPMGWYLISSFSQSQDLKKTTIKISGKDKMCKLNGEIGGQFTALSTRLDLDANNNKIKIIDIIKKLITFYSDEPLHNVFINDIEDYGFELLEYKGDIPLYLLETVGEEPKITMMINEPTGVNCYLKGSNTLTTLADSLSIIYKKLNQKEEIQTNPWTIIKLDNTEDAKEYYVIKLEYGEAAGYRLTDLVYAHDLIANLGESVVSVLDKIIEMLGNYEYFYNVYGQFVFQKKENITTKVLPDNYLNNNESIYFDLAEFNNMTQFDFSDNKLIESKSQNYNQNNIKNDFAIWGKRNDRDIYFRYAIDEKPTYYQAYDGTIYRTTADSHEIQANYKLVNWRELIYQMANDHLEYSNRPDYYKKLYDYNSDYVKYGKTGYEKYYSDILAFWREVYDIDPQPYYSKISHEQASVGLCFTDAYVQINEDNFDELVKEKDKIYYYYDGKLIRWIDKLDFITKLDCKPHQLYYYNNINALTRVIDSLNFKTNTVYLSEDIEDTLFNSLSDEDKDKVYVSQSEYGTKFKYQNYVPLIDLNLLRDQKDNGQLYVKVQGDEDTFYRVNSIHLQDDIKTALWLYSYDILHFDEKTRELLLEATTTHKNKLTFYALGLGEKFASDITGFYLLTEKNVSNQILWYKTGEQYYYLNEYFLHYGDDIFANETYDKHNVYFYYDYSINTENSEDIIGFVQTIDAVNIDKAKIHYLNLETGNLTPAMNNINYNIGKNHYYKMENEKMMYPDNKTRNYNQLEIIPDDLQQLFVDTDLYKVQQNLIYNIYTIKGDKSALFLDQTKKINWYDRDYDFLLRTSETDYSHCWNKMVYDDFNSAKFWIDFLDDINMPQQYKRYTIDAIGDRTLTYSNNLITGIDFGTIPQILYYFPEESEKVSSLQFSKYMKIRWDDTNTELKRYFSISSQGQSAVDVVEQHIENLIKKNNTVSMSALPIYWLDVNTQVKTKDINNQSSYYELQKITIPLKFNGKINLELISLQ